MHCTKINNRFLLQTGSGLELSSSCDHLPKHRPQARRTHPGCARGVGLAALLVTCTQAACPTVEPVPGTSPTASCITGRSGTASDRQCTVTLTQGFDISVSPRPINTDLYNGYRYLYGTEVNITCSPKTTDPLGSQDLIFLYPCSGNKDPRLWSDPSPNMTTLTLSSSLPAGSYWLGCWAASCTCGASPDPAMCDASNMARECIDGPDDSTLITVRVGHPSPQPTNFWCMSYDWLTLRCGWTLRSRVDGTVWSVSYWPPTQNSGSPVPCRLGEEITQTVNKGEEVNVTCTVEQQYFLRIQTFVFQVSDNNVFGSVRENFTTTTDISIVKLIPINGLTVVTVPGNSTVLNVSWELADRTKDTDCEWRIGTQAKVDVWMAMERWVEYAEKPCQSSHMLLDGLHAYVTYTVQIQIRLLGSQYWSDETKVQATTPEDKPSQSPELTPGGYVTWDCRQQKCLSLYWKSVPAAAQNGEIIYYQVVVKENETIVTNTTEKTSGNSMTVYIGQRDDVTLVVELSAGTSVGFSSPPSRIDIPPRLETPVPSGPEEVNVERQQNSVNAANATYTVTWSALPGHDQDYYVTAFWCKSKVHPDVPIECLAGMEWTHLPPNITAHTLDLTDEVGRQWYFGVSRTRRNVSCGVTWNRCVYDYMGVPSKPTLQASIKSETEMTVSWDFNMCDITFLKGLPVTYEIFYRKTDSANPSCLGESARNVTADVGVKSEVLPNLIYGATYGVCMRILTARNASDVSDVKLATVETLSVESTDRSNVPVFAGVLAAIVAVIMAIGILVFRWKLQLKATMFPSGNLWLPKPKTHGRWDVQIPVEQSLGTGSLPSHTIQVPHDAEIYDRPVTLIHNLSSWVSPVLDSNPTSSERRCGPREVLPPANISQSSLALVNGYFTPTVGENDSAGASTQSPGIDSRANRTGSENKSSMSAEYCTVQPVAHPASQTVEVETQRQINDRGAEGGSDNKEDTVSESSSPPEAKGQELKHGPSSGPAGAVAGDLFAASREAGINNTMELQPLTVRSKPSLHGGYISESSLCKSYDVRINNIPRNGYVSASLPTASQNFFRNEAVEGSTEVSARAQNSPKTLDCSPESDDERAVASDSPRDVRSPRSDVERSEYLVLDNTVADKKTHSSYNTTTSGADAATPYVIDISKLLAERSTYKSQQDSVPNAHGSTLPLSGYLPHHELSDKMSLASTTGMLTIKEESPSLGRTGDVSWEDGDCGNADIIISFQEREEEDKHAQPLMTISPSGYVMDDVHKERALTGEIGENWRKNPPDEKPKPLKAISPGNVDYVLI